MNETTPPPGTPGTPRASNAPAGTGFFTWIRGLGITRGSDRWFAGVAGGIAARAGIDPIIVRGLFIVLALLGGPGVIVYVAGWLLLPDQSGRIHVEEVIRGRAGTTAVIASVVVGAVLVLSFVTGVFGIGWSQSWGPWGWFGFPDWLEVTLTVLVWVGVLVAAAVIASKAFLRHGQKLRGGDDTPAASAATPASHEAPPTARFVAPAAGPATPWVAADPHPTAPLPPTGQPLSDPVGTPGDPTSHAGDPTVPLGARIDDWSQKAAEGADRISARATAWGENVGKQADEWSVRYAEHHERHKLGAAHLVITLALTLLAAGAAALVANIAGVSTAVTLSAALIAATATLAVSIIIAGVRGRRSGGLGFLAACGVVTLVFTSVMPANTQVQPFGVQHVTGASTNAVLIAGTSEINLTETLAAHPGEDITVWALFGNANVELPAAYPVEVDVRLLAGNVSGPNIHGDTTNAAGPFIARSFSHTPVRYYVPGTAAATADVPTVTIYMLGGNVRVENGMHS